MIYVYACERCNSTFGLEMEGDAEQFPAEVACPKCEYPHAVKLFPFRGDAGDTPGGVCVPGGSC